MPRSVIVTCSITSAIDQTDEDGLNTHVGSDAPPSASVKRSAELRNTVSASKVESGAVSIARTLLPDAEGDRIIPRVCSSV